MDAQGSRLTERRPTLDGSRASTWRQSDWMRDDRVMATGKGLTNLQPIAVLVAILLLGALVRLALVSLPSECPVNLWDGDEFTLCHDVIGYQLNT